MINMSFDEYDSLLAKFEAVPEKKQLLPYWPSTTQVDMIEENPERWLLLCLLFYEMNPEPKTPAEKYSRKNMRHFINSHLQLN